MQTIKTERNTSVLYTTYPFVYLHCPPMYPHEMKILYEILLVSNKNSPSFVILISDDCKARTLVSSGSDPGVENTGHIPALYLPLELV